MKGGALTDAFEVIFHPFEQVLTPIPTGHVLNGFRAVSGFLIVVLCPLVGVIVLPLTQHAPDFVTRINVGLIPVGSRRSAKDLVGIDVPVLHALHPVDAAVVFAQRLVDMTALIVIIVHVRVEFSEPVAGGAGKEPFQDIAAHVVQIVAVVVKNGAPVI